MMLDDEIVGNLTEEKIDQVLAEASRKPTGSLSHGACPDQKHSQERPADLDRGLREERRLLRPAQGGHRDEPGGGGPARVGFRPAGVVAARASRPAGSGRPCRRSRSPLDRGTSSATSTRWSRARSRTASWWRAIPHQLIEGLAIASYACQVDVAYIFIRDEYKRAQGILQRAMSRGTGQGIHRQAICSARVGTSRSTIHPSAGRYMCGEETGLLNALEGKPRESEIEAAVSRAHPGSGASRRSSTMSRPCAACRTLWSAARSGSRASGKAKDSGTKIYGVSGKVNRPGRLRAADGHRRCERSSRSTPAGCATAMRFERRSPAGHRLSSWARTCSILPLEFESLKEIGPFLRHGYGDRARRQDLPRGDVPEPGDVLRPGVVRLVYSMPRGAAVVGVDARSDREWRGRAGIRGWIADGAVRSRSGRTPTAR